MNDTNTSKLYSVEIARVEWRGGRQAIVREVVHNALQTPCLLALPAARKTAREMARNTQVGARVLDGDREIVRYLWKEGQVVEIEA